MSSLGDRLGAFLHDENLGKLHGRKLVQHILTYYRFPLAVLCLLLFLMGYSLYGRFTHRDVLLYASLVNVTAGDTLTGQLGEGFTSYLQADTSKYRLQLYTGLYLTDDELSEWHEYTYASRMKILAAIEGKTMDVVLMNKEAFDAFSQNGYLLDLDEFLSAEAPALYQSLKPALANNIVILEDNGAEAALDASVPYTAVTQAHSFGLDLSGTALIRQAGFGDTVYLGVVANTPRKEMVIEYLRYLTGAPYPSAGGSSSPLVR